MGNSNWQEPTVRYYHNLYLDEAKLSKKRFEGWTREYNKRKALEETVETLNRWEHEMYLKATHLEKENALLEAENRDLGTRILDLTKKLTAANDAIDQAFMYGAAEYRAASTPL